MTLRGYDECKTTEPDRYPSPGEHRTYDNECDCDECTRDEMDGPDVEEPRGCVLGADCLHHDPFHTAAECFDVEMAEHFMGDETP